MLFLLFALGSSTGRCLYLGSLNEGCKDCEGSRYNLCLGLPVKWQGIRNFVICLYQCGVAIIHTIFHGKSSTF